jgi:hypothetical protein
MKKSAIAALLATAVALAPWEGAAAGANDFLYGQRLYSLGDYAGALNVWRELAQQGDARAQYSMAVLFQKGLVLERDEAKALAWAALAAEQGYKPGQGLLRQLEATAAMPAAAKVAPNPPEPEHRMTDLQRTEAAVEDLLQQISARLAGDGTLHYGAPRTRRLRDAIQVTIPEIIIRSSKGDVFELGEVSANIRRLDERFDAITVALPGEVLFRNAAGPLGRITIAKRLARLRWDRHLETSTEFEFRLTQLAFLNAGGDEMGRIGEILARADVTEAQGLWSGPVRISLSKLNMTDGQQSHIRLESATLVLDFQGLDLPAHFASMASRRERGQAEGMPPLNTLLTMAGGVALRAGVEGLEMRNPAQGDLRLANANYRLDLSSPDGKFLNLALTIRHAGLRGTGKEMVPEELDFVLSLENLPIETLANLIVPAAVDTALLGQVNSGTNVFDRLRRELSAANTVLRLKQLKVAAPDYRIDMAMTLLADEAAKAGFVGGGDLRIFGLHKLLSALGIQDLPAVAALVKKGRARNGARGLSFALAVQPDGQLAVNGEPLLSLAPIREGAD